MTYYINPIWFYLMDVSVGLKIFLCIFGCSALVTSVTGLIMWIVNQCADITDLEDYEKNIIKIFKRIIIVSIISLFIGSLVPSKKACIEMMIASQITHENAPATKEEIYEIVDYVTDKINGNDK